MDEREVYEWYNNQKKSSQFIRITQVIILVCIWTYLNNSKVSAILFCWLSGDFPLWYLHNRSLSTPLLPACDWLQKGCCYFHTKFSVIVDACCTWTSYIHVTYYRGSGTGLAGPATTGPMFWLRWRCRPFACRWAYCLQRSMPTGTSQSDRT